MPIEHVVIMLKRITPSIITSDDIPDYFNYAESYTVCDRYFSEVGGRRPRTS